jgi:hypothetical protein
MLDYLIYVVLVECFWYAVFFKALISFLFCENKSRLITLLSVSACMFIPPIIARQYVVNMLPQHVIYMKQYLLIA